MLVSVDRLSVPDWAYELITAARAGRLGLIDGAGHPRVLPVTYALVGDAIWSAIDDKPKRARGGELARVRWLRERPQATLLVDRYSDDWDELAWVQLIGPVSVLDGVPAPAELISRYRQYRDRPPAGPMLRLDVERSVYWRAGAG